ncbi:MAG TPA: hypothetical protein VGF13_20920 [Verrucomicrobiae bacterium]|jgi:hypothetical protein
MIPLHHADDLRNLVRRGFRWWLWSRKPVVLLFTERTKDELAVAERRLNRHLRNCGCGTGAAFCLISLPLVLALEWMGGQWTSATGIVLAIFYCAGAMFASGLLGKFIGLALAKRRFTRAAHELLNQWQNQAAANKENTGGTHVQMHTVG